MKMKPTLQKRLEIEQKQHERFKKQYGIDDENVVVVEKKNIIKTLAEIIRQLLQWLSMMANAFHS